MKHVLALIIHPVEINTTDIENDNLGKSYDFKSEFIADASMFSEYIDLLDGSNAACSEAMEFLYTICERPDIEIVSERHSNNCFSKIAYDKNNDLYIYTEDNGNGNNALMYINGNRYILDLENTELYISSSTSGRELVYKDSMLGLSTIDIPLSKPVQASTRGTWIRVTEGFINGGYKQGWLTILSLVSGTLTHGVIAGLLNLNGRSVNILWAISMAVTIGQSIFVTIYYKCRQSYMSDCPTYIKQEDLYYQYSGYTGYCGSATYTFHSVNPSFSNPACLAYS